MKFKCVAFFVIFAAANSASIYSYKIPVRVIYSDPHVLRAIEQDNSDNLYEVNDSADLLQEETKISRSIAQTDQNTEIKEKSSLVIEKNAINLTKNESNKEENKVKDKLKVNLEEKMQLSVEDEKKSDKYAQILNDVLMTVEQQKKEAQIKGVSTNSDKLIEEQLKEVLDSDDDFVNKEEQYKQTKNVVLKGFEDIRIKVEKYLNDNMDMNKNKSVLSEAIWEKLNKTAENIFTNELKSSPLSIKEVVSSKFQDISSKFLSELRQDSPNQGFPQNILGFFQNGFQQIQSSLSGSGQPPASDTEATPRPNPIQTFVNQVQQIFQPNKDPSGVQSDPEQNPVNRPVQAIQSAFNQFQQTVSGLNPFNQQSSNASSPQNDPPQGTGSPSQPLQTIQNAFGQFQQSISNLNPFNRQNGTQNDETSTQNVLVQTFQNASNQFSQAVSNLNPFRPQQQSGTQSDETSTPNILVQTFQNTSSQFSQAINNLNPFRPSGSASDEQQPPTNGFIQTFQNVSNQFNQAINNLNPFKPGATPSDSQSDEQPTRPVNGIVGAFQNASNQFGQAINNLNPFNRPPSSTAAPVKDVQPKPQESEIPLKVQENKPTGFSLTKPSSNKDDVNASASLGESNPSQISPQGFSTSVPEKPITNVVGLVSPPKSSTVTTTNYEIEIIASPGIELEENSKSGDFLQPEVRTQQDAVEFIQGISIEVKRKK